ncbi:hypothetical protein C5167_021955 [Papaver somniferum]|uniref:Uncharacterized protein n=1 Tax=Papaver somniferum TaxID=3469 RepID=A0A4Y7JGH3_PAPSO|nr:hypothetical protein C5167_021955 [Papaver somniferum]
MSPTERFFFFQSLNSITFFLLSSYQIRFSSSLTFLSSPPKKFAAAVLKTPSLSFSYLLTRSGFLLLLPSCLLRRRCLLRGFVLWICGLETKSKYGFLLMELDIVAVHGGGKNVLKGLYNGLDGNIISEKAALSWSHGHARVELGSLKGHHPLLEDVKKKAIGLGRVV